MIANAIEIEGTLLADGKLVLDETPALPPGRVRVALRRLANEGTVAERLPDAPWLDESVSAPFDLPRAGVVVMVQPRAVAERLPELPIETSLDRARDAAGDVMAVLQGIHAARKARGQVPRTKEEIDAAINAMRGEDEEGVSATTL